MPKREKRGKGMTEHDVTVFRWNSPDPRESVQMAKAFDDAFGHLPVSEGDEKGGDALRRINAERMVDLLTKAGLPAHDLIELGRAIFEQRLGEDSAQHLAAEWLRAWKRWSVARERLLAGEVTNEIIAAVSDAAQDMGQIGERLWWRRGVDPATMERREVLALRGRTFTRPNKGKQSKTTERAEFLRALVRDFRTTNREALVLHATTVHEGKVRGLWDGANGEEAEEKIRTFLRNHSHLVFES